MGILSYTYNAAKQALRGKQKTTGKEVINPFKANPQTKESKHKINLAKIPGQIKRKYGDMVTDTEEAGRTLRQVHQKITGQKVTESGVSKGKDLKVEKKAKGGRIGYRRGTPKRETSVQKIKKTFGPKGLGMQSVIYGLDKNPKITAADPKAKFIAAANKKKKNMKKGGRAGFKGGSDMSKKPATVEATKKAEKRMKAAGEVSRNQGRSFGSIQREKYMR